MGDCRTGSHPMSTTTGEGLASTAAAMAAKCCPRRSRTSARTTGRSRRSSIATSNIPPWSSPELAAGPDGWRTWPDPFSAWLGPETDLLESQREDRCWRVSQSVARVLPPRR